MLVHLQRQKITGMDIEMTEIRTIYQIRKVKVGLQLNFPFFMAKVLKILLFRDEEALGCYLTAFYRLSLDEEMINQAIDEDYFLWLNYLWAFKKNSVINEYGKKEEIDISRLLALIKASCDDYEARGRTDKEDGMSAEVLVKKVCDWMLVFKQPAKEEDEDKSQASVQTTNEVEDNILQALLYH